MDAVTLKLKNTIRGTQKNINFIEKLHSKSFQLAREMYQPRARVHENTECSHLMTGRPQCITATTTTNFQSSEDR